VNSLLHGRTFGTRAARWGARLPADLPVLAFDETGIGEAYRCAVDLRRTAEPFFAWVCLPDVRAMSALAIGATFDPHQSFDYHRIHFDRLATGDFLVNGERADAWTPPAIAGARGHLAEVARLADGLFAQSQTELARTTALLGVTRRFAAVAPTRPAAIPIVTRPARGRWLVIWADGLPFAQTFLLRHALAELRIPLVIVAEDRAVFAAPGPSAPASIEAVLAGAAAVVDANVSEPSDALGLAASGIPLAVARTSGAAEYVGGAIVYDAANWRSVYDAAVGALAAGPPLVGNVEPVWEDARRIIAAASVSPPTDGPRVSVVIPTYNRRALLPQALRSISEQRYSNLEVIVVNDGGAPVDDIVATFPGVRLISNERNGGVEHAINTGYRAATGAYVTHVSDDDALYPDHIARLVEACERSGCAIAHGNTLIRFLRETPTGLELLGFSANVFVRSLEKTEAWTNSPVAGHALIIRRDVGERLGWYDETLPVLGDQEMQTRHAAVEDFVHVDLVTSEWRFTGGAANLSSRKAQAVPDAMRQWFEKHPSDRPIVIGFRRQALEEIATRPPGFQFQASIAYPPGLPPF
jgi:hypothetical protein